MRNTEWRIGLAAMILISLVGLTGRPVAAQKYRVMRLPMIGAAGKFDDKPILIINDNGQVAGASVVGFNALGNPLTRAFFWDFTNGTKTIPLLPNFITAQAYGLNNLGHVVGDLKDAAGHTQAFIWDSVNGTRAIPNTIGNATKDSHAYAINDNDKVVGTALDLGDNSQPYCWTSGTGMQAINNNIGGIGGNAFGVNNGGMIVGDAPSNGTTAAYMTTTIAGMTNITPNWATAFRSRSVNSLGDVIGSGPVATNDDRHGDIRYASSGAIVDIHVANANSSLNGHLDFNTADDPQAINNNEQIVGTVKFHPDINQPTVFDYHAYIWDSFHQMRDLNDMLPAGSNMTLYQGASINNRGQIVCWADVGVVILNPQKTFDTNGDGKADLVNQYLSGNAYSVGQVAFWRMSGASVLGGVLATGTYNGVTGAGWQVVGTGDFDGDGKSDLVLQHTSGMVAFWFMNGTTVLSGAVATGGPTNGMLQPGWSIVGVADINGDGKPDLVLQHTSGQVGFWIMDGTKVLSSPLAYGGGNGILPAGWIVAGTGDINGDGLPDLALYNTTTGAVAFWLLNGTQVLGGVTATGAYNAILPAGWIIAGVDDYNGDGKPDLALFNTSSGQVAFWFLNGSVVTSGAAATGGSGNGFLPIGWRVQGPK